MDTLLGQIDKLCINDIDRAARRFFCCLKRLQEPYKSKLRSIVSDIRVRRPLVRNDHLPWLLFASIQHLSRMQFDVLEDKYQFDEAKCFERLGKILSKDQKNIVAICSTHNICTNVTNRYAGLQIIAGILANQSRPIRVLDVGCSLGLGLMSLNTKWVRKDVTVRDPFLIRLLEYSPEVELYGIDIFKPTIEWLKACYLPEYEAIRRECELQYNSLITIGSSYKYVKGDALRMTTENFGGDSFDIVWTSNVCYELEGDEEILVERIRNILKPDGFWLYAYYRGSQPNSILRQRAERTSENPYVVAAYPADNWDDAMEVIVSVDDNCHQLSRGEDFVRFLGRYAKR